MIVRDEAAVLGRCLESAAPHVDEIVVVDTGSTDDTIAIARRYGAIIGHFTWIDDFAAARNAALALATGEWVLSLDADEALDPATAPNLRMLVREAGQRLRCYGLLIRNHRAAAPDAPSGGSRSPETVTPGAAGGEFEAGWESGTDGVEIRHFGGRLFRRHGAVRWIGSIHEVPGVLESPVGPKTAPLPVLEYVLSDRVVIDHFGYAADAETRQRKIERNVALLRRAMAREPEEGYYPFKLGQHYLSAGDAASAARELTRACELARRHQPPPRYLAGAYQALLSAHLSSGAPRWLAAARDVAAGALRDFPDHPWLWYLAGRVYEAAGERRAAGEAYRRSAALAGRAVSYAIDPAALAGPHVRLGRLALNGGDAPAAMCAFRRALALRPLDREALLGLAEAAAAAGQPERAIGPLEQFANAYGEHDSVCALLGESRHAAGDLQGAYDLLWDALQRHPEFRQTRLSLARLLLAAGEPAAAVETLAPALETDLAPPAVYSLLAEALDRLGRLADAEQARLLQQAAAASASTAKLSPKSPRVVPAGRMSAGHG